MPYYRAVSRAVKAKIKKVQEIENYGILMLTARYLPSIMFIMNRLSIPDRAKILGMLVEGNSLRSCARMADVSLNTVTKLLVDLGAACDKFHNERVRNVRVRRLQADEIWCFIGAKAKNVTPEQKMEGWGDVWTWTGPDGTQNFASAT